MSVRNSPIKPFPVLETKRLVLREIRDSDASEMFTILMDREITQRTAIPEAQRKYLNQLADTELPSKLKNQRRERMLWAITLKSEDRFIGRCGYEQLLRAVNLAELGYWLARQYWGKGIMTETIAAILRYGFDQMQLETVSAWVMEKNPASVRILEKNGFLYDRPLKIEPSESDNYIDLHRYRMNKNRYETLDSP